MFAQRVLPVAAQSPPVSCVNDPELVTAEFAQGSKLSKLKKLTVELLPGGQGYSGPIGFYRQLGGAVP